MKPTVEEVSDELLECTDPNEDLVILRNFARAVAEEAAKIASEKPGRIQPLPEFRIRRWAKATFGDEVVS